MKAPNLLEPKPFKTFRDKYLAVVMMVAALLITSIVSAQSDSTKYSQINGYGFKYKRHVQDSVSIIPLSTSPHTPYRAGGIRYRASDSTIQVWTGNQWNSIITGVGNGVDTAYMVNDTVLVIETPDRDFMLQVSKRHVDTLYRKAGQDSIFYRIAGVERAIKDSSGTSIILANIGTGFRWVASAAGNIKTLIPGYGLDADSTSTANTITIRADTSELATQYDLTQVSGTPTAGYGIGVTGSQVKVDTTVIDARYRKLFNVVLYGADPDSNGTDDCPAIKAAVQAAYDAGGGIVYFPLGHYTIGCALQHSVDGVDPDAQIVIPLARDTATKKVRITFEGEAENNWSAELVTVRPKVKYGVILESTILDTGYVFGSAFYNDGAFGGDINWNWWGFKNIEIRVRTKTAGAEINNTMSGINSTAPRSVNFDHVKVTVQSAEGNMLEPSSWTEGVRLPHWNNNGNILINNLNVSGYYNGVIATEHMNATELITFNCHNGLYLPYAFHSGNIDQYTSEGCVNHIYVSNELGPFTGGPLDLHIGTYNVEHYTVAAQWNTFAADVTFADTSSPARVFIDFAHMAESSVGKVATFVTNAPYRVKKAFNGVDGSSDFLIDDNGAYKMDHAASTTVDNNILKLGATTQTGGFIFGSTSVFDYTSGPHIGARGNTYSAFANQRGMLFIAGGQVNSPTGNEGSLLFQTQNINRMVIGYNGTVKMPYLTKSASTSDSALYPNPTTGDLELRPIAGASTPSLQTVLNAGRTGDTIVMASSSGTNRDIQIYNENAGVNDLAVLRISGRGTNAGSLLNVIPKGSGFSGIQSQVGLWNTSDEGNPEVLQIRATGTNYIFNSYKDASGSLRPIKLQMGGTDAISVATTGAVTFNASTNAYTFPTVRAAAGQVLTDVGGNGTLSWETPSAGNTIYTGNGTLAGNRHISGGASGHSLQIDSTASISLFSGLEFISSGIGSSIQMSDSVMSIGSSSATDFTSFVFSPTRIKFTAADGAGNAGDVWTNTGSGYGHWAAGPKTYTALLSQSGTSNPTATVLGTNGIGSIVWTRNSTGNYTGTLSSAFTANKTWLIVQHGDQTGSFVNNILSWANANSLLLTTTDNLGNPSDGFTNMSIEIRVYP